MKLFSLPDDTKDLSVIIDKAGDFLIQLGRYEDGIALVPACGEPFSGRAVLHQVWVAARGTKASTAKPYRRHAPR
jgi:hypothetical protein